MDCLIVGHGNVLSAKVLRWIKGILQLFGFHLLQVIERKPQILEAFHDQRYGTGTDSVTLLYDVIALAGEPKLNDAYDRGVWLHFCVSFL